jgi:hypothetical protein
MFIDSSADSLLAAEVTLSRPNRNVSEEELHLQLEARRAFFVNRMPRTLFSLLANAGRLFANRGYSLI